MGVCQEEKIRKNPIVEEINNGEFNNYVHNYQYYKNIIEKREISLIYDLENYNQNNLTEMIKSIEQISKNGLQENENNRILSVQYNNEKYINYDLNIIKEVHKRSTKSLEKFEENTLIIKLKENPPYYFAFLFEKLYSSDKNQIINILKNGPPNNLRWHIWIAITKYNYNKIQNNIGINNNELFYKIEKKLQEKKVEKNAHFEKEINNYLNEMRLNERFWMVHYNKLRNCIKYYHKELSLVNDINYLIIFPLIISDGDLPNTFYFLRFLFSSYYGLGLNNLNDIIASGISSITLNILKNKNESLYNHILSLNLTNDEWLNKWIYSLYSNILNISITVRLWDCIIAIGIKFILYFNIGFIEYFKNNIFGFNTKETFLNFFNKKLKEEYKSEEKILLIREKLIEYALKENIEDDILKFDIIIFIKNYETNKNDINETKKQNNEEDEKNLSKEKEEIKTTFFNLFGINNEEIIHKDKENYEIELLKKFAQKQNSNKKLNTITTLRRQKPVIEVINTNININEKEKSKDLGNKNEGGKDFNEIEDKKSEKNSNDNYQKQYENKENKENKEIKEKEIKENKKNAENIDNKENIDNTENIDNKENIDNIENKEIKENTQIKENKENIENKEKIDNTENKENLDNTENKENIENTENKVNIENSFLKEFDFAMIIEQKPNMI